MGTEAFRSIFGSVPAGDEESTVRIVLGGVRAGFSVVLVKPGLKSPMCTLSAQQAKAADTAAREQALAEGRPRPGKARHYCGIGHALFLTGDPELKAKEEGAITRTVRRVLKQSGGAVNLGVELGRSRMVVVDVDTAEENAAFLADRIDAEGPEAARQTYTVQSPGARNAAGELVHSDGGHYWFTVPEGVTLPDGADGALKTPTGWTVMWNNRQVLVPPSSRPEGPYRMVGAASPAPAWITDLITAGAAAKLDRKVSQADRIFDIDDPIDRWSAETPWSELLDPDDWTDTGLVDNCSCPIWTAPGDHSSPKSATAHELGCSIWDSSTGWAPLRVWTDSPPSWLTGAGRNITKLRYVALRDHDGVDRLAMSALGLLSGGVLDDQFPGFTDTAFDIRQPSDQQRDKNPDTRDKNPDNVPAVVRDPFAAASEEEDGDETDDSPPALDDVDQLIARMRSSAQLDDIQDPEPLVAGMLDLDSLTRMTGKSGHGKTFVMIDLSCCVATGRPWHGHEVTEGMVVYMVAEGIRGYKKRVRAWEARYNEGERIPPDRLLIYGEPIQVTDSAGWANWIAAMKRLGATLVVMDTQARITVGVEENSATDMGKVIHQMDRIKLATKACVCVVHHLGHQGEQGRGSSAMLGALETEIRVSKVGAKVTVVNEKQKDAESFETIELTLNPEGTSAVLESPAREDPWVTPLVDAHSHPLDRMLRLMFETMPMLGATEAAARKLIRTSDKDKDGRPMIDRMFSRCFDKAAGCGDLIKVEGSQRWKVSANAIERLALRPPQNEA